MVHGVGRGRKKKYAEPFDNFLGDFSAYTRFVRLRQRRDTAYCEWFGWWLNRRRLQYANAFPVALGVGVAMGLTDPPLEYYRVIADGEVEAWVMQQQQRALRRAQQSG